MSPAQLHVHAVAATSRPNTPTEIAAARAEILAPLSRAFVDSTFTGKEQSAILDLCAKYRPVDCPPYRPNPRTSEVVDKCVNKRLEWGIIGERPSPWGSPCTIVATSNGSPRFGVDYRHTLNRHIIRKSWPMPNLESCLDAVGDALYISVADILSAVWQLPVAEGHVDRTAFVTPRGKYCFKRTPLE